MHEQLEVLIKRYPDLRDCALDLQQAFELWKESFVMGHKTLVCGNGGSAADSEHIVGELMKGFLQKRPVEEGFFRAAENLFAEHGRYLANHLQGALPAISLASQVSLLTAFGNDVTFDMIYAQQVYGYGQSGDVLVALSTSGNALNVLHAAQVAKLRGLKVLGFTGSSGGRLREVCDVIIRVPDSETYRIQECHLAIYHTLCSMLEEEFWPLAL